MHEPAVCLPHSRSSRERFKVLLVKSPSISPNGSAGRISPASTRIRIARPLSRLWFVQSATSTPFLVQRADRETRGSRQRRSLYRLESRHIFKRMRDYLAKLVETQYWCWV